MSQRRVKQTNNAQNDTTEEPYDNSLPEFVCIPKASSSECSPARLDQATEDPQQNQEFRAVTKTKGSPELVQQAKKWKKELNTRWNQCSPFKLPDMLQCMGQKIRKQIRKHSEPLDCEFCGQHFAESRNVRRHQEMNRCKNQRKRQN